MKQNDIDNIVNVLPFCLQLARLQQELAQAQDRLANSERVRQSAERQVKDLEVKLEELEAQGGKALKNQIKKLEQRVSQYYLNCFNVSSPSVALFLLGFTGQEKTRVRLPVESKFCS